MSRFTHFCVEQKVIQTSCPWSKNDNFHVCKYYGWEGSVKVVCKLPSKEFTLSYSQLACATRQLQKNLLVWNAFWIRFVFFYFQSVSGWNKQTCLDQEKYSWHYLRNTACWKKKSKSASPQKTKFLRRAFLQSLGGIFRTPPVTETENANCKVVSHHISEIKFITYLR